MKRMNSFAAVAIALAAMLVTSCGNKNESKLPDGQPIGEGLFLVEQTAEDGTKTVQLQDSTGVALADQYAAIADSGSYLAARKADGIIDLLSGKGATFARCSSFEIKNYYATTEATPTGKFAKTMLASNGNHLGFDVLSHKKLISVEGIKDEVLPLDNGFTFYKIKGLWGIAKSDAEAPIADGAKEIIVVTTKAGKTYYWLNTKTGAGLIDEAGKIVKRLSPAQMKAMKKKAKTLWNEDGASAIWVKAI